MGAAYAPELASFRGDDHPGLVAAALSCRVCLSGEVDWSLALDDFEGRAQCRCRRCGDRRELSLTSEQCLRLALQGRRPLDTAAPLVLGEPIG